MSRQRTARRLRPQLRGDSKFLSLLLRHNPGLIGLELDPHGWADIDRLLALSGTHGRALTRKGIEEIVAHNDKRRFSISEDEQRIRANQGHTVDIDLDLPLAEPPPVLYHGTGPRRLEAVLARGIRSGVRPYVQLRPLSHPTLAIGARRPGTLAIEVDACAMHADGFAFRKTDNDIWLTAHVPANYIRGWEQH